MELILLTKRDELEMHDIGKQMPEHLAIEARHTFLLEMVDDLHDRDTRSTLSSPVKPQGGLATVKPHVETLGGKQRSFASNTDTVRGSGGEK